jgi:hypothetical protein
MFRKYLMALLIFHTAMTFYFLRGHGFWSVFPPFQEGYTWQIFSDLVVSISIVLSLVYRQLKIKKEKMTPFYFLVGGTVLLGSFAPLAYLIYKRDLFTQIKI